MLLATYTELIRNLPYLDQAFETRKETWDKKYQDNKHFRPFFEKTFTKSTAIISRADLFKISEVDFKEAAFSIILWGYPRNMRGDSFGTILNSIMDIEELFSVGKSLSENDFLRICKTLNGKGLGLSTLTKFLYFFNFRVGGFRCLILDTRIIEVLNAKCFGELILGEEINDYNKARWYKEYLQIMDKIAKKYNYSVDQLELFLFMFGRNLKA
jgi:hypothetical protein